MRPWHLVVLAARRHARAASGEESRAVIAQLSTFLDRRNERRVLRGWDEARAARWADTVAAGHSGNLAGYTSQMFYDTQRKYGVIVLRSAAGGQADAGSLAGRAYRKLRSTLPK